MAVFKNDIGAFFLGAMFYEQVMADKSQVVYTLKDRDHAGYPSLYRLYMEADDPTEYTFATKHLDCWAHWERLIECTWFKPYIERWRRELEVRARAKALMAVREIAKDHTNKEAYQANKYLLSGGWKDPDTKRKAGQPSKAEVQAEAHRLAQIDISLEEDFERIHEGKAN